MQSRPSRQHGAAILEFLLIVPFLLILSILTTEFGRALHQYDGLTKAVRDGARFLSAQTPSTRIAEARNLVVYGTLSGGGAPLVHGLGPEHVPQPVWQAYGSDPVINTVTVSIQGYRFTPMIGSAFGLALPAVTFPTISATMRTTI